MLPLPLKVIDRVLGRDMHSQVFVYLDDIMVVSTIFE